MPKNGMWRMTKKSFFNFYLFYNQQIDKYEKEIGRINNIVYPVVLVFIWTHLLFCGVFCCSAGGKSVKNCMPNPSSVGDFAG